MTHKIELIPFTSQDFDTFKSWVQTTEELFQFAGQIFTFPLTDEQLFKYINMPDKKPFKVVLQETGEAIGHCEMNFENGNNRISRVLVGKKELRGQKIGEQIIEKLVQLFFQDPEVKEVDLNTFDWNKAAISCYEKIGFKINPNLTEQITVNGNNWTKINMTLKR